jgi:hypothetical protein
MRVALICPGRGTYTKSELGSLSKGSSLGNDLARTHVLRVADQLRQEAGRLPVFELDQSSAFSSRHLRGENAAALIFTGSAQDYLSMPKGHEVVAVCGNSMGWYTALFVSGARPLAEAFRVADTCGSYQTYGVVGGQVVYPLVDDEWRIDSGRVGATTRALEQVRSTGHAAYESIRLGGQLVLAADDEGVRLFMQLLPKVQLGERHYPMHLQGHSAFHTPLMDTTSVRAQNDLKGIAMLAPNVALVDGRGVVFQPWSTSGSELSEYTYSHQITRMFDFTAALRVVLREFAPDALVLLGPGHTLGGSIGQVLIAEGWNGLRSKADFVQRQLSSTPILYALGRPDQAALFAST